MNKNTMLLLGGVVVLAVVAYFATRKPAVEGAKSLEVKGYASAEQIDARSRQGIMDTPVFIDYPVDEVIYTYKDETVRLVREGDGKTSTWLIKSPVDAVAVKYQVEKMVKLFESTVASIHSTSITAKDHVRFDLEPESRVAFTFKSKGEVWNGVDFVVGKVINDSGKSKGAGGQDDGADTWVMKKGEEGTLYRLAGKDLRAPFEVALSDLRDKKALKVKASDLVKLEVVPPKGPKVVLSGVRTQEPAKAKPDAKEGEPAPEPTYKVSWSLTEPAGVRGDKAIDGLARNFANLRTREFVAGEGGPKGGIGLAWTFTGTTHDGRTIGLTLADADAGDQAWAQVVGSKEFLKVDKFAAKNLRKSLADLKDKALFGDAKPEAVTMLETAPPAGAPVRVERRGDSWVFTQPAQDSKKGPVWAADPAEVLRTIVTARATRFATPTEVATAQAALTKPEFVARLTVSGVTHVLKVGPKMEAEGELKNQRWALLTSASEDSSTPLLLQDFTASRFRKTAADLRRKTLFDFEPSTIESLTVAWPDNEKTRVALKAGDDGKLAPTPLPAGKKVKAGAVTTMTATLAKLKAKGFVDGKSAAELGLDPKLAYVVTGTLAGGKSVTVTISKKTDGTDPYATVDSGALQGQFFTLNKFQVDNLQKSPADLVQ